MSEIYPAVQLKRVDTDSGIPSGSENPRQDSDRLKIENQAIENRNRFENLVFKLNKKVCFIFSTERLSSGVMGFVARAGHVECESRSWW